MIEVFRRKLFFELKIEDKKYSVFVAPSPLPPIYSGSSLMVYTRFCVKVQINRNEITCKILHAVKPAIIRFFRRFAHLERDSNVCRRKKSSVGTTWFGLIRSQIQQTLLCIRITSGIRGTLFSNLWFFFPSTISNKEMELVQLRFYNVGQMCREQNFDGVIRQVTRRRVYLIGDFFLKGSE